jgi:hypothetical protein
VLVAPPAVSVRRPAPPTAQQVVLLQSVRSYPCLTLLLTTEPGPTMAPADARRLEGLLASAAQRLRAEGCDPDGAVLATAKRLVAEAVASPTSTGLAVFASSGTALVVPLPVDVRERVVVDPTFATRDLVRALHRTPRHLVLALSSRDARLFEGSGDDLRPARGSSFPMLDTAGRGEHPARDATAFLRSVDKALGTYLQLHPAPLVLAGPTRVLATFAGLSRNLGRLAGQIPANVVHQPLSELAERTRPVLERYLHSRQQEALELLDRRTGSSRAVSGMTSAWLAARTERPEMLAVEQGLFFPARLSGDGDLLLPATDVEHPDVLDDAVDELIELVLDRGGWVALVDDGALAAHDGVALTVRARS